jgi:predicted GIY-YIG superfamily endonuclease
MKEQFCIYLIPYTNALGKHLYCGYTQLQRVEQRGIEHANRDKRHYTGPILAVEVGTNAKGEFGLLIDDGHRPAGLVRYLVVTRGSNIDTDITRWRFRWFTSRKEATAAERFVKRIDYDMKRKAYELAEYERNRGA